MDSTNPYKVIGVIVGALVGLILAGVFVGVSNKTKDGKFGKFEYDERQELFNGKSYKFGFLASVIYSALLSLLALCGVTLPAVEPVIYFSVLFVGVTVMSSYSIWNDSYWGIRTNKKLFLVFMSVCSLINFAVPISLIITGKFLEDGKIGVGGLNLMCGLIFLAIFIQDILRGAIRKREDSE